MELLKAKVCLEDNSKVTIYLNTDARINVMIRKLIEDANLTMTQGLKLDLVSHTDDSQSFFTLCEDVKIAIRELKTRHLIFVVKAEDNNLLLSQLFLYSMKFSQKYKPDGIFGKITHLHIY